MNGPDMQRFVPYDLASPGCEAVYAGGERAPVKEWLVACFWAYLCFNLVGQAAAPAFAAGELTIRTSSYAVEAYIAKDGTVRDASYRITGYIEPGSGTVRDDTYRIIGYVDKKDIRDGVTPCSPQIHASRITGTCSAIHRIDRGLPFISTTIVGTPVWYTALTKSSCRPVKSRLATSQPSPSVPFSPYLSFSPTTTMAISEPAAAC